MDLRQVIPLTRTFSKIIHGAYALVKKLKARAHTHILWNKRLILAMTLKPTYHQHKRSQQYCLLNITTEKVLLISKNKIKKQWLHLYLYKKTSICKYQSGKKIAGAIYDNLI